MVPVFGWGGAEVSPLSCKTSRGLGCGWHLGDLGILERDDLPLVLFLYHVQRWGGLYFWRFVAFLALQVSSGDYFPDIVARITEHPRRGPFPSCMRFGST